MTILIFIAAIFELATAVMNLVTELMKKFPARKDGDQ